MTRGLCKHEQWGRHGRCACGRKSGAFKRKMTRMQLEYPLPVEFRHAAHTDQDCEFAILADAKENGTDDFELAKMASVIR